MLAGIKAIHTVGFLHRDIKPVSPQLSYIRNKLVWNINPKACFLCDILTVPGGD